MNSKVKKKIIFTFTDPINENWAIYEYHCIFNNDNNNQKKT